MWPQGPSVLHTPEQEPNCWSYVQVVASPWQCWVGCSRRMNARLSSFSILFSVCGDSSVAVFSYWLFCNLLLIKIVISCLFSCQENPLCTTCTLPSSSIFFFFPNKMRLSLSGSNCPGLVSWADRNHYSPAQLYPICSTLINNFLDIS